MRNRRQTIRKALAGRLALAWMGLTLALVLGACSGGGAGEPAAGGQGNPIPTPRPGEEVSEEPQSAAKDTPEGTWEGYLRDSLAIRVSQLQDKITLFERYENPDHTAQNLGGLMRDITLLEDRTTWNIRGNSAAAVVEFEVRVTFANGDTDTRTCQYEVFMEYDEEDDAWYVLSPLGLDVDTYCGS